MSHLAPVTDAALAWALAGPGTYAVLGPVPGETCVMAVGRRKAACGEPAAIVFAHSSGARLAVCEQHWDDRVRRRGRRRTATPRQ